MEYIQYIAFIITLSIFSIILTKWIMSTFLNFNEIDYVKGHDNRKYLVLNLHDKREAADKLADINNLMLTIIRELETLPHESVTLDQRKCIGQMRRRFKSNLIENAPGGKTTSYTLNKGDSIYMCLRTGEADNKIIDDNTLIFVALHELSHIMTQSIGHTFEFWGNFRFILSHAIQRGHYKYFPYHLAPKKYCGSKITSHP